MSTKTSSRLLRQVVRLAGIAAAAAALPAPLAAQTASTKVVSTGNGWKILEVTNNNTLGLVAPTQRVWMVNKSGVASLPVSQFQKDELNLDFQAPDGANAVIFVVEPMAFGVEQGQVPPGWEEYAEAFQHGDEDQDTDSTPHRDDSRADAPDPYGHAPEATTSCFGWSDKTYNKSYNYAPSGIDRTFNLGSGVTGTFMANVPLSGNANLTFRYKIKKFACVPYKFKFVDARLQGALTVAGHGNLSASASITGHWEKEWKLAEPQIGSFTVWLGPVPVYMDVTLPIHAGLTLDISIMGTVSAQPSFGAYGTFNYLCTSDGCSGTNSFQDNFDLNGLNASATLDIDAKAHARVMGRVAIYSASLAYVEGGLKGLAIAELWGYYGNTCGDADGNGVNETVQALAADLSWGYDVVYGIGGFLLPDRTWTQTGPRYPLYWKDLLGAGGSTALQPMLLGPSQVNQNTTASYTVRMRPCYPYTQQVNFTMAPGTWTGNLFIPQPKSTNASLNSSVVSRSFGTAGSMTLTARSTTDGFSRNLQVPYSRTINVVAATPSAPSGLAATVLSATSVRLNWTDNSSNETGFELQRRVMPSGAFGTIANPGANITTSTDNGAQPGTSYEYRVRAVNGANASAWSNVAGATTPAAAPAAPSGLTASFDGVSIRLNWIDNSNNETGFNVQFSYSGSAWSDMSPPTVGANVTTYTSGPNPPTGSYQFRVRAFAGSLYSGFGNVASLLVVPPAPEVRVVRAWDGVEVPDGGSFAYPATPVASLPISRQFQICNDGNAALTIGNPTTLVSGTGFSQIDVAPATPVQPGTCTTFRVRFHVATPGTYTGAVTINNNDPNENPYNIALSGVAQ